MQQLLKTWAHQSCLSEISFQKLFLGFLIQPSQRMFYVNLKSTVPIQAISIQVYKLCSSISNASYFIMSLWLSMGETWT